MFLNIRNLRRGLGGAAVVTALALAATTVPLASGFAEPVRLNMGGGPINNLSFLTGGLICQMAGRSTDGGKVDCRVEGTPGSAYNLHALRSGELDMAVVAGDAQMNAYQGSEEFDIFGPFRELRSVFSLYDQALAVVVRQDSEITSLKDLAGKTIYFESPDPQQKNLISHLVAALGLEEGSVAAIGPAFDDEISGEPAPEDEVMEEEAAKEVETPEAGEAVGDEEEVFYGSASEALCENGVDAVLAFVSHPNPALEEMEAVCPVVMLPVSQDIVDALISDYPFYTPSVVPANLYLATRSGEVPTIGVKATLVSTTAVSEDTIYNIVRAVINGLDDFANGHPGLGTLDPRAMSIEGNVAPLHRGAMSFFKRKGLM